jgi:hypothetical protein
MESKAQYTYDNILEMMGGYSYFEPEQIKYVFHKLNNEMDKAQYFLDICLEKANKLKEVSMKLKTDEEHAELWKETQLKIESLENTDIDN